MRRAPCPRARLAVVAGTVAVTAMVLVAACAPDEADVDERGPLDPEAAMDTEQIVAEPAEARPGDTVEVRFPQEHQRGIHLVLERAADGDYHHAYDISTNVHTDEGPLVVEAGTEGFGIDDIGIVGPGPDPLPIPDDAPAGDYRVCTGNAGENVCAPVTIRASQ
ncbi:hypothetical protein ER308_20195 [Egibacter rhizosphaerae]|uniref:EfeO-type cupredoxin-like domain-containing protein n=1 Tax=Egibacter rhizosphaerae TaxID=1670831 RepID=A0A411YKB8_9ACTN|nr:hypothetical protein [Egibacter rhizosphaerae]QBI21658.1 hypothetical protein ER308_20195 [Egibacter rhizosphaerae]